MDRGTLREISILDREISVLDRSTGIRRIGESY